MIEKSHDRLYSILYVFYLKKQLPSIYTQLNDFVELKNLV